MRRMQPSDKVRAGYNSFEDKLRQTQDHLALLTIQPAVDTTTTSCPASVLNNYWHLTCPTLYCQAVTEGRTSHWQNDQFYQEEERHHDGLWRCGRGLEGNLQEEAAAPWEGHQVPRDPVPHDGGSGLWWEASCNVDWSILHREDYVYQVRYMCNVYIWS